LTRFFTILLLAQLILGALVRHFSWGLLVHIATAVVVILVGLAVAVRAWGRYDRVATIRRLGVALLSLLLSQLLLGIGALIAIGIDRTGATPHPLDVALTTAHQANGALLLACAVALTLWLPRLLRPE
jgi:heme A synthase